MSGSQQITTNSPKNNARPFVIPGAKNSPMRVAWMQGDYYYWMVQRNYPKGYPTAIHCDYQWQEELTPVDPTMEPVDCICLSVGKTITAAVAMNTAKYEGKIIEVGNMTYSLGTDNYPVVTIGDKSYKSQNRLLTSDDWATNSSGTSGDNHPTKLTTWVLSMTYDGHTLIVYRNGLVDQVISTETLEGGTVDFMGEPGEYNHNILSLTDYYAVASPLTVQRLAKNMQDEIDAQRQQLALQAITLPAETRTDLVLPATSLGQEVSWTSSNTAVIGHDGVLYKQKADKTVTLKATIGTLSRDFQVKALAYDASKNLRYELPAALDLTQNTAAGFTTNKYGLAPEGLLQDLRSYTILVTVNAKALTGQPRIYDFGSGSGNSLFLRANPLAAGIKLGGGTTTMVSGATTLQAGKDYRLAVTYSAATRTTTIYIEGEADASGTQNQSEACQLYNVARDTRNYIGRTQWWDGAYASDNQDFRGTISSLQLYDVCLSQQEICQLQHIDYQPEELPASVQNADFEGAYSPMQGSGVTSDRAIYVPQGWTVDYSDRDQNDITALKSGDPQFASFFASRPVSATGSKQTYWVRQKWGASTITLKQDMRLKAGKYVLTADVWQSGQGGSAVVSAATEGSAPVTAPALADKTAWQQASLSFMSDGQATTTIRLTANHTTDGQEKIIGFDNVALQFRPMGDANGDGLVNVTDVTDVISYILGRATESFDADVADVNGDGLVNVTDVTGIINIILGKAD